ESYHTPSPEVQQTSSTTHSSPTLPPVTTATIPTVTSSDTPPLRQYTKRTRIAQSSILPPIADEHVSPLGDSSQGEACPTDSSFVADQKRANIAKTSTLPHDSARRVTSPAADDGNQSGDDSPIKGRRLDVGEEAAERVSNDTEEMATVLTSMDAATVLSGGVAEVPTGSSFIPTAGPLTAEVPTGSDVIPTVGLIFATATVESVKKLKTSEEVKDIEEVSEDKVKEMMQLVLVEEIYVEALQFEHLIIDWKLWALVKESLNIRSASSDKEIELWVELKRLYEPDVEDQLWNHTQNIMHAPVEWKLYDSCGVHHVTSKDNEIFMLIEKDYPLKKGLAIMMISYKLQLENYSQMANDLILKIYKIANCPSQKDD
nr:hypothetical protein [Tanacetum cinerariifolium]